eukprot:324196-Pelagomonas_calceolata.AAC.1
MPNSGELGGHGQIELEKRPRSSEAKLLGGGWMYDFLGLPGGGVAGRAAAEDGRKEKKRKEKSTQAWGRVH